MPDLDAVHARLRSILEPYRDDLAMTKNGPDGVALEIPGLEGNYLMPLYATPELAETISPELRRRMQGKSCFNFTTVDEPLLAELAELTARGIPPYREMASGMDGG